MNKTSKILIIFIFLFSAVVLAYFQTVSQLNNNPIKDNFGGESGIVELTGTVTTYNTGCYVDATCFVEIDNKYLIVVGTGRPRGTAPILGKNNVTEEDVGAKVKIRAKVDYNETDAQKWLSIDQRGTNEKFYLLKITDHFACSDYCPGPKEKYMKTVYEGISDPQECTEVRGFPYEYRGWVVRNICLVNESPVNIKSSY